MSVADCPAAVHSPLLCSAALRAQTLFAGLAAEADTLAVAAYSRAMRSVNTHQTAEAFSRGFAGTLYMVMATDGAHAQFQSVYTGQAVRPRSPFGAVLDRMDDHFRSGTSNPFDDALAWAPGSFEAVLIHVHVGSVPSKAATLAALDFLEDAQNSAMVAEGRSFNTASVAQRRVCEWDGRSDRWAKLLLALTRHRVIHGDLVVSISARDPLFGEGAAFGKAVALVRKEESLIAGLPERRALLVDQGFDFSDGPEDKWRRTRIILSRTLMTDMLAWYAVHGRQLSWSDGGAGRKLSRRLHTWRTAKAKEAPPSCLTERLDTALRAEQARHRLRWRQ
eukprot:TRINITY_DN2480_c0_g1_i3.p1 TRINITY_DN2480_c0_g1~~TRINITY_DN2480_c0_g1_i3.p1  ORF type:complete len:335 (+),score=31.66 TRINITY_DN2480_c0_g1_i3:380-1384(+)